MRFNARAPGRSVIGVSDNAPARRHKASEQPPQQLVNGHQGRVPHDSGLRNSYRLRRRAAAGCAAAAVALAGWEHKPQHLSPEGELTTYG
jgi:hypothetical protein